MIKRDVNINFFKKNYRLVPFFFIIIIFLELIFLLIGSCYTLNALSVQEERTKHVLNIPPDKSLEDYIIEFGPDNFNDKDKDYLSLLLLGLLGLAYLKKKYKNKEQEAEIAEEVITQPMPIPQEQTQGQLRPMPIPQFEEQLHPQRVPVSSLELTETEKQKMSQIGQEVKMMTFELLGINDIKAQLQNQQLSLQMQLQSIFTLEAQQQKLKETINQMINNLASNVGVLKKDTCFFGEMLSSLGLAVQAAKFSSKVIDTCYEKGKEVLSCVGQGINDFWDGVPTEAKIIGLGAIAGGVIIATGGLGAAALTSGDLGAAALTNGFDSSIALSGLATAF